MMHPLWHLLPALVCATVAWAVFEIARDIGPGDAGFWTGAVKHAAILAVAVAAAGISLAGALAGLLARGGL